MDRVVQAREVDAPCSVASSVTGRGRGRGRGREGAHSEGSQAALPVGVAVGVVVAVGVIVAVGVNMTFNALGGLANRLRAIFSRYDPPMSVVWTRTWDIAMSHFLEVFEPVPGIEFVPDRTPCDEESWHAAINYADWHQHYRLLRPTAALRERIAGLQHAVGEYVAIHVRRTDHVKLAHTQGKYTEDGEFVQWAHETCVDTPTEPCFLATCNAETRQIMARHIGARVFWQGALQPSTVYQHESQRYGTLADAVVDLFMCVGARSFMGTPHSSFSQLVEHLRELR